MLFFCKTKHFSAEEKETLFLMQMYLEKGRFCSLLLHQCCSLPPAPYFRFRLCPGFTFCLEPKIITPKCPRPANPAGWRTDVQLLDKGQCLKLSQAEAGFEVHQPNAVFVSPCLTAQLCLRAGGRPSEPPLTAVPATADRIKRGKKKNQTEISCNNN